MEISELINWLAKKIGHLYPFALGCATFGNLKLFRSLDYFHGKDDWADVVGGLASVPSGDLVARAMKYVGDLDRRVSWVVDQTLSKGDTALDIGANLGLITLRMASLVGPAGNVHAFEPQSRIRAYLSRSIEHNRLRQVSLHPYALGKKAGSHILNVPTDNAGAASISNEFKGCLRHREAVDVSTLDDFSKLLTGTNVALVKIDVEGYEKEVLLGGERFFRVFKPHVVVMEETRSIKTNLTEPLEILSNYGYRLFSFRRKLVNVELCPVLGPTDIKCRDFVAVSLEAPRELLERLRLAV